MFEIAGGILIAVAVLALLYKVPSFLPWLQERTYRKATERRQKWEAELKADPAARKLILEDADWLKSTPKKNE